MSNDLSPLNPGWMPTAKRGRSGIQKLPRRYTRKTALTKSRLFSIPYMGGKPFSSIGRRWHEPKRTFDSDMRSWLQIVS